MLRQIGYLQEFLTFLLNKLLFLNFQRNTTVFCDPLTQFMTPKALFVLIHCPLNIKTKSVYLDYQHFTTAHQEQSGQTHHNSTRSKIP